MSRNGFDDFDVNYDDDEEKGIEATHRDLLMQILDEAKMKYIETDNEEFEDILQLKNGIGFIFDEEGSLIGTVKELL